MNEAEAKPVTCGWAGVWRGFLMTLPLSIFVVPIGVAFGVAAVQAGLSPLTATLMSAVTQAGAAQFSSLAFWKPDGILLLPMLATVAAVNARMILMGASLYPWFRGAPAGRRYLVATFISDPSWALGLKTYAAGERDLGFIAGSGLVLWMAWVPGTIIGAYFGQAIANPELYGLDVVIVVFFAALAVGMWQGRASFLPWVAAGLATLVALETLPENWHVMAGALAGGLTAAFGPRPATRGEPG